jgi:dsRNA-specific ribonuclease
MIGGCREEDVMGVASQSWDGGGNTARDPAELRHTLGVPIMPKSLERALTHRSYAYEHDNPPTNERLEFLGDSVLGLVVTDTLFRGYPNLPEGQLAKLRAAVVQMGALAEVAWTTITAEAAGQPLPSPIEDSEDKNDQDDSGEAAGSAPGE